MPNLQKPLFLLAGHAKSPDLALAMAVSQAGKLKPTVAYIGAASGDNQRFFRWMKSSLHAAGAGSVELIPTAAKKADREKAISRLWAVDLIHIGGGDVEAGMQTLEDRDLIEVLKECFHAGKPFSGLSAGSIMLGKQWIKWTDPHDDGSAQLFPCLGLAPVCCDTHSEDDDFLELKALAALSPDGDCVYGIHSSAALIVNFPNALTSIEGVVRTYKKIGQKVERIADVPNLKHGEI